MAEQDSELKATVFAIDPPKDFSNGRELLDALITDSARASQGALLIMAGRRPGLALPSWGHKRYDAAGLNRYLDLKFRVLWPRSDAPALEVSGGNRFTLEQTSGSDPETISPTEIHERFPEAAKWVRNVSDISLTAHMRAISTWFRAAASAGWKPRRMALAQIPAEDRFIISGQGRKKLEEPLKSIILARTPVSSPGRIDLFLVARTLDARATKSMETAFRKLWPSLPVSIRHAPIERQPTVEPPALALLVIPDDEDILNPPWIDWLRKSEEAGALFRIVRQPSLHSTDALGNLCFDLFMLAGGVPWTADTGEEDETVLGLDAGHNHDERWSRWICARLNVASNAVSSTIVQTELAEHIPQSAIQRLLTAGRNPEGFTVFRDGRFLSEDPGGFSPDGMIVSVAKYPVAILYRQLNGHLRPTRFGDALRYPDGRILLQTSSNRDTASGWKMPIQLRTERSEHVHRAVSLCLLLCRQPALGLYAQPRLPAPIYWADLISKTTATGWPKVVGRGLGLNAIIPK